MASTSPTISFSSSTLRTIPSSFPSKPQNHHLLLPSLPVVTPTRFHSPLRASRRFPNHPQGFDQEAVVVVPNPRSWREIGDFGGEEHDVTGGGDDDEDEEEEEEEDRSLDLLVRFLHNVFRKISRRASKAVRSVLPPSISSKLVRFSVNGVLILAFLWILKAFLEVVCTLGSMVFVSILLVRGVLSGVSYMKESRYNDSNRFDNQNSAWTGVQAAT